MKKDKRTKGCLNKDCSEFNNKVYRKAIDVYCPRCGVPLRFVCAKCFTEIEDNGIDHRICKRCEAENERRLGKVKNVVGNAVAPAAGAVEVAAGAFKNKVGKEVNKEAKKVGQKAAEKVMNIVNAENVAEAGEKAAKVVLDKVKK